MSSLRFVFLIMTGVWESLVVEKIIIVHQGSDLGEREEVTVELMIVDDSHVTETTYDNVWGSLVD